MHWEVSLFGHALLIFSLGIKSYCINEFIDPVFKTAYSLLFQYIFYSLELGVKYFEIHVWNCLNFTVILYIASLQASEFYWTRANYRFPTIILRKGLQWKEWLQFWHDVWGLKILFIAMRPWFPISGACFLVTIARVITLVPSHLYQVTSTNLEIRYP